MMTRVGRILEDAICFVEVAGTLKGGERRANELLDGGDELLEGFPLFDCAAAKPHAHAVSQ